MKLPSTAAPFRWFLITKNDNENLRKFPKGICFAFSGLFFLLTLVVLFQSDQPFGVAAVIAYLSSLTLTILLFSAPYFATYFINYYRKLHQIEEAILLLAEQKGQSELNSRVRPFPPYSSVFPNDQPPAVLNSLLESSISAPIKALLDTGVKESDGNEEVQSKPTVSKPKPPKPEKDPNDEFQLSLFDLTDEADQEADECFSEEETLVTNGPEKSITVIEAYLLLESGQDLFIRGDEPFSWDKGSKLRCLDVGKYTTEPFGIETPIEVSFLVNDSKKKMSARCKIVPEISNECYPEI